jgi:hypothetical protein
VKSRGEAWPVLDEIVDVLGKLLAAGDAKVAEPESGAPA